MQTALLPDSDPSIKPAVHAAVDYRTTPLGFPKLDHAVRLKQISEPCVELSAESTLLPTLEVRPGINPPGLFLGIRTAMIFYLGLALASLVVYEAWKAIVS